MSDKFRYELTGKRGEAWDRIFDSLLRIVEKGIDNLTPDIGEESKEIADDMMQGLGELTKGWLKAKLDKPVLENEKIMAEIALKFEELKLQEAKRDRYEVNTERTRLKLENERLELWENRMTLAFKWLEFLTNKVVRDENGVYLVMTNQDVQTMMKELKTAKLEAEN